MTLGADVVPGGRSGFVLTRLHYRYGREGLDEDLVFRPAHAIVGGRGMPSQDGTMPEGGAQQGPINNFQGRYVILHKWQGPIACDNPQRGIWGGPPGQGDVRPIAAPNVAMETRTEESHNASEPLTAIGPLIRDDIPALGLSAGHTEAPLVGDPGPPGMEASPSAGPAAGPAPTPPAQGGCASCSVGTAQPPAKGSLLAGLLLLSIALCRLMRRTNV
jgi:hypothetical protein